jgi:hypothetical protein
MDQLTKVSNAKTGLSRHPMLEQELTSHADHNAHKE